MAITTEVWEDSGAATGSPAKGTTRIEVDNLGFKDSSLDETFPFADYPVGRPYGSAKFAVSYPKYYFFKIYGTYDYVNNMKVKFVGNPLGTGGGLGSASKLRIYYKWTSTYETPTKTLISGSYFNPSNPPEWTPLLSTTGPETGATWLPEITTPNQTYYTQYLVTQLYLEPSDWDDYGNLNDPFKLEISFDERKSGLPGYDPELVNWSW